MSDETVHRQAKEGLRQSEERYRTIIEEIEDGYYEVDIRGNTTFFNSAYCEIMGYPRAELEGINYRKYMDKPTADMTFQIFNGVYKSGKAVKVYDYQIKRKDGNKRAVSISVSLMKDDLGRPCGFRGILRDVTERKRAEEALQAARAELEQRVEERTAGLTKANEQLREEIAERKKADQAFGQSQEMLSLALDGANLGIWDWDLTTGKAVWTERTLEMLGYHTGDLEPDLKTWKRLVHPDDWSKVSENLNIHLEGRVPLFEVEYRILDKLRTWRWLHARGKVVKFDAAGRPIRIAGIFIDIADRKKTEEELWKSEAKYRFLTEHASDLLWTLDLNLRTTFVTPSVERVLGFTPEERMLQNVEDQLTPESLEVARQGLFEELNIEREQGVQEGKSVLVELDYYHKNGSIVCLQTAVTFIRDEEGTPIGLHGISRDITEIKRSQEALRVSEERYRALFDNAPVGIFQTDSQGRTRFVNPHMAKLVAAKSPEQAVTHFNNLSEQLYADSQRRDEFIRILREEGEVTDFEYEARRIDGAHRWFSMNARISQRFSDGEFLVEGFTSDITDRRQTEENLKQSEERYRQITENSLTGIFVYQDGRSIYANRRLAEMLGYSPEEILNIPFREAIHPDDRDMVQEMAKARLSGQPVPNHYQLRLLHKDGHTVWSEVLSHRIYYEGRPAILGNIADVTESRNLRQQLFQAQKMEAIGTLTGGIAHDFNNLLTIINGYTEMILLEKTEDDPSYSDLQKVLETGRKGAGLVQRLLALSKKGESSPQPLDLNRTVEDSVALMERTFPKIIEIETALEKELDMVNADTAQVEQVLMNLCINAKEAMPEGGRLRIETRNTFVDEDYCRLHPGAKPGRHILLGVSDTGSGIDTETMDRMFDPFFTTKGWDFNKGTGLGLSVAKGIVEQHGGWMTCETEPVKGTTFRLYFPIIEDSPAVKKPEAPTETFPDFGKILLVDDEELVRDLGKRILERAGYTVIAASNGKEALGIYAKEQSSIALVVLDLIMPQMGGEKCLHELLKINPNAKVVVSTGHSLDARERLLLGSLAKGFVNKPYEVRQLVQTVKGVLKAEGPAE